MLIILIPILYAVALVVTVFCGVLLLGFDSKRELGWEMLGAAGGGLLGLIAATALVLGSIALLGRFFDVEAYGAGYDPYYKQNLLLLFWTCGLMAGGVFGWWCVNRRLKRGVRGRAATP